MARRCALRGTPRRINSCVFIPRNIRARQAKSRVCARRRYRRDCGMTKANNQARPERELRKDLTTLRDKLLVLHKALIESERIEYESSFGTIATPNHFLKLLIDDPWFAWLQPFSSMVAAIDARLDDEEPISGEDLRQVKNGAIGLLQPSEEG